MTDENAEEQGRVDDCNKQIREVLEKYGCVITCTELNIQTGRIIPIVRVVSRPHIRETSEIIRPP